VQVEPHVEIAWFQLLKLKYDSPLSNFDFNFNFNRFRLWGRVESAWFQRLNLKCHPRSSFDSMLTCGATPRCSGRR